ncbi:fungal-specific transcription factor domain-containing protein [Triangularia verruculosa]|uniref:Fungal-specific transcription factor domain-containing protein n=1 Tax=Triangularia verruculosa TaxID=2587418 RepID=A0AAN6XMN9_9PEZI|nr:fungal-specific transcription factor domain-containing protein [Triangularia verruculosa]
MDAATLLRQTIGAYAPRPVQPGQFTYPRHPPSRVPHFGERLANAPPQHQGTVHTLTACCRCRQRKTKCDPALPRCTPCDRAGQTCEYFDTTKNRKMNRTYVVELQRKVQRLESELEQLTGEDPNDDDDMVTPGGLVHLNERSVESPRYLGPSSGIAMTRILMGEAKRYTDSLRISSLIPELRSRRTNQRDRMQSVVMGSFSGPSGPKALEFPLSSDIPAKEIPNRATVEGLWQVFKKRIQVFTPVFHETAFSQDIEAVFNGDTDHYRLFAVNMMIAIGLAKVDRWAGLPDTYYLSAMKHFDHVVRPKDLKTLQCLILMVQYSLLMPIRTAIYHVVGLAIKICQQWALGDESTLAMGDTDPQSLDLKRRLVWIVLTTELGLAHMLGRPNGFSRTGDMISVKFFEAVEDDVITPEATPETIQQGRLCERKAIAIHYCKVRLLQAEIRRVLYEQERPARITDADPWFQQMDQKLKDWFKACPEQPALFRPWFTNRYHAVMIILYRPSPQILKPTAKAAMICFEAAKSIITCSSTELDQEQGAFDQTWVFLQTINSSLNALLWSIGYAEVRAQNSREEVEQLVQDGINIITNFHPKWPGVEEAINLYQVLSKACLQSYNTKVTFELSSPMPDVTNGHFNSPFLTADPNSPDSEESSQQGQQPHSATSLFSNQSPFGYNIESSYSFDPGAQFAGQSPFQNQPAFRSNSIFMNPMSSMTDAHGRRLSELAPESTHYHTPAAERKAGTPPMPTGTASSLPTPPESLPPPSAKSAHMSLSPRLVGTPRGPSPTPTPTLHHASPLPMPPQSSPGLTNQELGYAFGQPFGQPSPSTSSMAAPSNIPAFTIPPIPGSNSQQRPTTVTNWSNPPAPIIQPHTFAGTNSANYWESPGQQQNSYTFGSPHIRHSPQAQFPLPAAPSIRQSNHSQHHQQQQQQQQQPPHQTRSHHPPPHQLQPHSQLHQQQLQQPPPSAHNPYSPFHGGLPMETANPWHNPTSAGLLSWEGYGNQYFGGNERHDSLTQEQQTQLLNILEADGMSDISAYLASGNITSGGGGGHGGAGNW